MFIVLNILRLFQFYQENNNHKVELDIEISL